MSDGLIKGSLQDAAKDATDIIIAALLKELKGAADDVKTFGVEIGTSAVSAFKDKDEARLNELKAQIAVLAELHRLELNNSSWDTVDKVLDVAFKVVLELLKKYVPVDLVDLTKEGDNA